MDKINIISKDLFNFAKKNTIIPELQNFMNDE